MKSRDNDITFNVTQTRDRFKKCISICKAAALKIKTASGIERFQAEKSSGGWFNVLFPVVKTCDACNPQNAVEPPLPGQSKRKQADGDEVHDNLDETAQNGSKETLFIPTMSRAKKKKVTKQKQENEQLCTAVELLKKAVESDPTTAFLQFMKDDLKKSREHELKLFQMLTQAPNYAYPPDRNFAHPPAPSFAHPTAPSFSQSTAKNFAQSTAPSFAHPTAPSFAQSTAPSFAQSTAPSFDHSPNAHIPYQIFISAPVQGSYQGRNIFQDMLNDEES